MGATSQGAEVSPAGRRRGATLVQAIHHAALSEMVEHGYEGFSMERVAERAGAGKASLYRRWSSRFELILDALDHTMPRFDELPDTGSLREDLLIVMRAIAEAMNSGRGAAARSCLWSFDAHSEVGRELRQRLVPPRQANMLQLIRRGAERGEACPDSVSPRIAELGPKLLHGEILEHGAPISDEAVVGIVDEVLLPLLRP